MMDLAVKTTNFMVWMGCHGQSSLKERESDVDIAFDLKRRKRKQKQKKNHEKSQPGVLPLY